MEITTLRLVLRRGFVLSEYISGDYNVCVSEERIPMPELSPETNGEERVRWKLLGFVVISKKIPTRTQDHVMHSNERRVLSTYPTQTDCGSNDTT